jgi:sugar O-acyltransferase (sialic acid O-acetyltransferase NeuD family)
VARRADRVLVWGAGGHGRVVADVVTAAGHTVVAFVDKTSTADARLGDLPVVEESAIASGATPLPHGATAIALGIGDNAARARALGRLASASTPPFVHPTASVAPSAKVGRGTVVMPLAVINNSAAIGDAVIVNSGAIVEHDCFVGDAAHISPGAVLAGGARVGARAWIGAGAVVIQGVKVGDDVVVGAGAVVIRDVPDGVTVAGVPATVIQSKGR